MPSSSNARRQLPLELVAVTLVGLLARVAGLFHPREAVFDEVHTLRFVGDYLSGTYYLDVHPPLGIQLFALTARALGLDATTLGPGVPVSLRILPALFGTLLVPLTWILIRQVGGSRRAATLGGLAIALDNALVLQSRLMLTDIMLVTFGIGAVVAWLASRGRERGPVALVASALLAGMAASIKWTGLSALGLVLLMEALAFFREPARRRAIVARMAVLGSGAAAVYAAVFAIHFATVDRAYHRAFLPKLIQRQGLMLSADRDLQAAAHFYASPWYSWPLLTRPIHYWSAGQGAKAADIYLIGNPVVWWGSFALLLAAATAFLRARRTSADAPQLWGSGDSRGILVAGFALNWLPFAGITRLMFLYHYLHALVFAVAIAALLIGRRAGWSDDAKTFAWSSPRGNRAFWVSVAAVVALFLFFAPITYGWALSPAALKLRLWLPGWG